MWACKARSTADRKLLAGGLPALEVWGHVHRRRRAAAPAAAAQPPPLRAAARDRSRVWGPPTPLMLVPCRSGQRRLGMSGFVPAAAAPVRVPSPHIARQPSTRQQRFWCSVSPSLQALASPHPEPCALKPYALNPTAGGACSTDRQHLPGSPNVVAHLRDAPKSHAVKSLAVHPVRSRVWGVGSRVLNTGSWIGEAGCAHMVHTGVCLPGLCTLDALDHAPAARAGPSISLEGHR